MQDLYEAFGLDEFGLSVYRAVARRRPGDAASLAEHLGRPVDRVLDELRGMEKRGLVRRVDGAWEAEDPQVVLARLATDQEAALQEARARLLSLRTALYQSGLLGDFLAGRRRVDTTDGTLEMLAADEIPARVAEMIENARSQVRFLYGLPRAADPSQWDDRELVRVVVGAASRGVRVLSVWSAHTLATMPRLDAAEAPQIPLDWVRAHPAVPMMALLVDDEAALVPYDPDDLGRGAFVVRAPVLVALVRIMIDAVVRESRPLSFSQPGVEDAAAQRRSLDILALLYANHTDEAIAKRLGVNARTVRRYVADLMAQYGVNSRFALGVKAARLGLLPAES